MTHIVLAEDDQWLGELYVGILQAARYSVDWRQDAYAALDAIDERRPAVLVLDMWLPQANGIQLLQEIASHTDLAGIPVVLCSSESLKSVPADALAAYGVAVVINKTTSNPAHFLQTIQEVTIRYANLPH